MANEHLFVSAPKYSRWSLRFEAKSLLGRVLFSRKPPLKNGYCNLGCGQAVRYGYCNADFFDMHAKITSRKNKKLDWEIDLRYPLNCDDNFFCGVFLEHVIEHVDISHGRRLLKEIHRILRPGGILRITAPSLEKYIDYYNGNVPHKKFLKWDNRGEALWSLAHNWNHRSVYDYSLLEMILKEANFANITRCEFLTGQDKMLLLDGEDRSWETLYVEAMKDKPE